MPANALDDDDWDKVLSRISNGRCTPFLGAGMSAHRLPTGRALAQALAEIIDGKPVSGGDRLFYALGNLLVYGPLRNVLGMSRIRVAYTAGAAIGPDLFRFYRSIGINLKQLYGSTETCAYVCLQPDGHIKFDSVGTAAPGQQQVAAQHGKESPQHAKTPTSSTSGARAKGAS